jgi:hypothetical protein
MVNKQYVWDVPAGSVTADGNGALPTSTTVILTGEGIYWSAHLLRGLFKIVKGPCQGREWTGIIAVMQCTAPAR